MDWDQALRAARQHESHLLTISDKDEDAWIEKRFGSQGTYWLGFAAGGTSEHATWLTGEPVSYTNWQSKQPAGRVGKNAVAGYYFRRTGWATCAKCLRLTVILESPGESD